MTVKKDPKRQLLGKIAKARGKQFESRIDDSFAYYAQKGFAIIEKTPEPMHPTKKSRQWQVHRLLRKAGTAGL